MDQSTWNLLFGWITGKQCFIPEGCSPPLSGITVYIIILALILGAVWKREVFVEKFSELFG
ncbi:MAG: hypothetical protein MUP63_00175 [Candidatus Nanohaloarchaeota archaeon QJJ-7]|nr:hypothetical protein [Candidatus Nanohaloarchaeota archaeon QJJ-7]